MKKILYFLFTIFIISACQKKELPVHQPITIDIAPIVSNTLDDSALAFRHQRIKAELDYYLKRHTVADEGYDMVARYAEEGNSQLKDYSPKGIPTLIGMLSLKGIDRQGIGATTDSCGNVIIGMWKADTLTVGLRIDSTGIFAGQLDNGRKANGHGCQQIYEGGYYEGHWNDNLRSGFGFLVDIRNLQAGTWRKDRFFGEHMKHTSDRIYGIDISRYQHENGRKRYGIEWNDLRVTHLGRRITGNITGEVDYPVRFVYIKSTQGTTIRNRYYVHDYAACRKKGIPIGAYHFFSTIKSGRMQAKYFLDNTLFRKGDLPPVLDIEPTDRQIAKMGGAEKMLREIRVWIEMIEQRVHVRPILYVNQNFIKKYLMDAPDLLDNYQVWIARYGEYKPGIHLSFWQLSADARVKGIATDVDVNVFNGYEPQWQEFLEKETIK